MKLVRNIRNIVLMLILALGSTAQAADELVLLAKSAVGSHPRLVVTPVVVDVPENVDRLVLVASGSWIDVKKVEINTWRKYAKIAKDPYDRRAGVPFHTHLLERYSATKHLPVGMTDRHSIFLSPGCRSAGETCWICATLTTGIIDLNSNSNGGRFTRAVIHANAFDFGYPARLEVYGIVTKKNAEDN